MVYENATQLHRYSWRHTACIFSHILNVPWYKRYLAQGVHERATQLHPKYAKAHYNIGIIRQVRGYGIQWFNLCNKLVCLVCCQGDLREVLVWCVLRIGNCNIGVTFKVQWQEACRL